MRRKNIIITAVVGAIIIVAGIMLWKSYLSPTRIAFVNYQAITLGQISRAKDNSFIKIR